MIINTNALVPMTDANQNFSKVIRMVDDIGLAIILKNNKPRYVVMDFEEYDQVDIIMQMREKRIEDTADMLIGENMEAFKELAK